MLHILVGKLPLASAARRSMCTWRRASALCRFENLDEGNSGPRSFVFDDAGGHDLTRHGTSDEMRFAILSGDSLSAVCDVVWVQFEHRRSVPLKPGSTVIGWGIVAGRHGSSLWISARFLNSIRSGST